MLHPAQGFLSEPLRACGPRARSGCSPGHRRSLLSVPCKPPGRWVGCAWGGSERRTAVPQKAVARSDSSAAAPLSKPQLRDQRSDKIFPESCTRGWENLVRCERSLWV